MDTFSVKNYDKYQHYKHRCPPWIKLYYDLLDDDAFISLSLASRHHYMTLLLIAGRKNNVIPLDTNYLKKVMRLDDEPDLTELFQSGFLLASRKHVARKTKLEVLKNALSETETETETETEKSRDRVETEVDAHAALAVCDVVELWNSIPGLPKAERVTGPIAKSVAARINEHPSVDWFQDLFHRVSRSDFLTGRKTDFVATIDWVLGPKNLAKVLNGNYDNRAKVGVQDPNGFLAGMQAFLERA